MARPKMSLGLALLLTGCALELLYFVLVLCLYEAPRQNMISDTIWAYPGYKVALTVLLGCRTAVVALFLYSNRGFGEWWTVIGCLGASLALAGWGVLISRRDNTGHFSGVGVFCAGSLIYSLTLVDLAGTTHEAFADLHRAMTGGLLLTTVALVPTFTAMYAWGDPQAFVPEHLAYITFVLFYALFFYYHWPTDGRFMQRVTSLPQCAPLLPLNQ